MMKQNETPVESPHFAPKFIGIGPLLAKLQVIEVDPRFVNISIIFEILFFIFQMKMEVLPQCCKIGSRNAIPMIFGAKCRDSIEV